ncbi:MAG: type II secretion system F family protein [Patescibacteria group bacterium]|nr:type II secretion system F family protein [Patescibacteria group bacterium]MDE1944183.1 type II secretion system F family protein [Patescibacteria group bacterium]MDE2057574.1 type II secretion system F family protein [Patescibacteria group bacterium]
MLFKYRAIDKDSHEREGTIEAFSQDGAVAELQRRELVISLLEPMAPASLLDMEIPFFNRIPNKDIVIFSRQIATLFEAQVSALRIFRLLASEVDNHQLAKVLTSVADDLQGGSPISAALARHPEVFTPFYVNMVRAGEESGKLSETFSALAEHLDKSYEVTSRAENALIYPAFVIVVFFGVMALMLTLVIPKISAVLIDSGTKVPIYTSIVIGLSQFLVSYGIFILIALIAAGVYVWRLGKTAEGKLVMDGLKLSIPYLGDLYSKLYLARVADTFAAMLLAGVTVVEALDITASVVGNSVYQGVIAAVESDVRGGSSISDALGRHPEVPGIMVAMVKVGEETGELGNILMTLAKFYDREVSTAIDTLVGLIEPLMIVLLGLGVGVLLAAILLPIYNLASAI